VRHGNQEEAHAKTQRRQGAKREEQVQADSAFFLSFLCAFASWREALVAIGPWPNGQPAALGVGAQSVASPRKAMVPAPAAARARRVNVPVYTISEALSSPVYDAHPLAVGSQPLLADQKTRGNKSLSAPT
jgi:hypothetical protein